MQQSPLIKINSFKQIPTGYVDAINLDEKGNLFASSTTGHFLNDEKIGNYNDGAEFKPFYFKGQYWQFTDYKTLKSSKGIQFNLSDYIPSLSRYDISPNFTSIDKEGRLIIAGNILLIIDKNMQL